MLEQKLDLLISERRQPFGEFWQCGSRNAWALPVLLLWPRYKTLSNRLEPRNIEKFELLRILSNTRLH
ncbi:MAG: hypothetical protein WAN19_20645, partial [Candidatus Sulfotelmatobacter sp.]